MGMAWKWNAREVEGAGVVRGNNDGRGLTSYTVDLGGRPWPAG